MISKAILCTALWAILSALESQGAAPAITDLCSRESTNRKSGVYQINVPDAKPFDVYCNMSLYWGRWLVIQRRQDGSVNFTRPYSDYVRGFGYPNGEFWLGLDTLHNLTAKEHFEMRVDMQDSTGNQSYHWYLDFKVGPAADGYPLFIDRSRVNTVIPSNADCMQLNNNSKFSTYDKDQDLWLGGNCASSRGAWWYGNCSGDLCNLNGLYNATNGYPISWKDLHRLQFTEMKIRHVAHCPALPLPAKAYSSGNKTERGSKVTFDCYDGYGVTSGRSFKCKATKLWDPATTPPTCAVCPVYKIWSPEYSTQAQCLAQCSAPWFKPLVIRNSVDYDCVRKAGSLLKDSLWTALSVRNGKFWALQEQINILPTQVGAFPANSMYAGPLQTLLLPGDTQQSGPVYLYTKVFVLGHFNRNSYWQTRCGCEDRCMEMSVHDISSSTKRTFSACEQTCAQQGVKPYTIRTEKSYQCARKYMIEKYKDGLEVPLWIGMRYSASPNAGLYHYAGKGTRMPVFENRKAPNQTQPGMVWDPIRDVGANAADLSGPVYLQNRWYVVSTDTSEPDGSQAACLCSAPCPKFEVYSLNTKTKDACAAKCSALGQTLVEVRSANEYDCLLAAVASFNTTTNKPTIPVWTGMSISGGELMGLQSKIPYNPTQLGAQDPYWVWNTPLKTVLFPDIGQQSGPIYLHNDTFVLTTPTHYEPDMLCACQDADECSLETHDCHPSAKCTNTHGSFTCECPPGFQGNGHGSNCVSVGCSDMVIHDITTGTNRTFSGCVETCRNNGFEPYAIQTANSYDCALRELSKKYNKGVRVPFWTGMQYSASPNPGLYSFSDKSLRIPVFENHNVSVPQPLPGMLWYPPRRPGATPAELNGPVYLHNKWYVVATDNFKLGDGTVGNPTGCLCSADINECSLGTHNCHQSANCINLQGSFKCECLQGFQGDGITCTDIDECKSGGHRCHTFATCNNVQGSYQCRCRAGYVGDGLHCMAVGCSDMVIHDITTGTNRTFSGCVETCHSRGFEPYAIQTAKSYGCALGQLSKKYNKGLQVPFWTGMEYSASPNPGLYSFSDKSLRVPVFENNNVSVPQPLPGMLWYPPRRPGTTPAELNGPVYLHNNWYVVATDNFKLGDGTVGNPTGCLCSAVCGMTVCGKDEQCQLRSRYTGVCV